MSNPQWYWTQTTSEKKQDKLGRDVCLITCALKFEGYTYHILTGPTAAKSLDEFCIYLNENEVPAEKLQRCVADGSRLPKDGGKDQLSMEFLAMVAREELP